MPKFIEVKCVETELMTRSEYNIKRGWTLPKDECSTDKGYFKTYPDGHIQWDPAEVFEKNSLAYLGEKNSISEADVDGFIKQVSVNTLSPGSSGSMITAVTATLVNGFTITETSTCVNPDNYDIGIGIDICEKKINDKIRYLLGFLLACGVNGFQKGGDV